MVTATVGPSTLPPSTWRKIICKNHHLAKSERCQNLTSGQSGKNTATVASVSVTVSTVFLSSTNIPFIASTSTTYVEVTVGTKTAIALSVITIVYVIIVLILKYKFSIPWRRALALGVSAGHVTSNCFIYIYPRHDVPGVESSV